MRKSLWVCVVSSLAISGAAFAGPYGTAGCGLGSMVFGDQKGMIQIVAATLNGCSGSQTFAITFGTSNCEGAGSGGKSAKVFIEGNRDALAKDISKGAGETVTHLAQIAGCSNPKTVGSKLQSSFKAIFPSESASNDSVTKAILETLSDKTLACTNVS